MMRNGLLSPCSVLLYCYYYISWYHFWITFTCADISRWLQHASIMMHMVLCLFPAMLWCHTYVVVCNQTLKSGMEQTVIISMLRSQPKTWLRCRTLSLSSQIMDLTVCLLCRPTCQRLNPVFEMLMVQVSCAGWCFRLLFLVSCCVVLVCLQSVWSRNWVVPNLLSFEACP